jgi:outer membrane lipoprotein SlyB
MKKYLILLVIFIVIMVSFSLSGCYYDNEEELYQYVASQQCDTTNVTFSGTILPIFNSSCNNCHNTSVASGGIILDTYTGASTVAANGHLWGSLSWTAGFSPMPQSGAQLNACDLKKIKTWINAGHPDN